MRLVVDAGLVIASLVDVGPEGSWADSLLDGAGLAAPHHMPAEVANILRRGVLVGSLSPSSASAALADLMALDVELFPFPPLARRVWELRDNVTAYDAWYIALAETLGADLATVDRRLVRAAGPRCRFRTPPPLQ